MSELGLVAAPTEEVCPMLVEQKSPVFLPKSQISVSESMLPLRPVCVPYLWVLPGIYPEVVPEDGAVGLPSAFEHP